MTGKYGILFLIGGVFLLMVGFFLVPLGETSAMLDIVEGVTPQPPPLSPEFTTFSPVPPVDISQLGLIPTRITTGQCCSYAGWSTDSEWVLFLDGGGESLAPGLYGVPRDGGTPGLITSRFGNFSKDWSHVAYLEGGQTYVEQWGSNSRWTIPSNGREVVISPDLTHVVWEFGSQSIQSPDRRQTQVWIARINGENPRELVTLHGGAFHGWADGSQAIIVTGRLAPSMPAGIWRISTSSGAAQLLFEVEHPRGLTVSPNGAWIAFIVAFEQDNLRNGLWVMKSDGSFTQKLRGFGAYRWRSDGQLLFIPMDLTSPNLNLYQVDILAGKLWRLIDPERINLEITNNDWTISPNGRWLLYQSSVDRNLWVLELPQPPNSP